MRSFMILMFCLLGTGAAAQDAVCKNRQQQIDPQATSHWRMISGQVDPMMMHRLVGVWNQQMSLPTTGQVAYTQYGFEPTGLFQYRQKVCSGQGSYCSDFEGFGQYIIMRQQGEGFMGMLMVSDMNRDHVCIGFSGQFMDNNTIFSSDGNRMQRAMR